MNNDILNLLNIFLYDNYEHIRHQFCNCNDLCANVIAFFSFLCSLGLLILGYIAKNDWQKTIKSEKYEDAKRDLVYSIIDLVSTLRMHCYEDLSVSQISELNPDIYEEIGKSVEANRKERSRIDIEITNKYRLFNKNLSLFIFYSKKEHSLLIECLNNFKQQLWKFAQGVNMLVMKKLTMYLHLENDYHITSFEEAYKKIQPQLAEIEKQKEKILCELKEI